MVREAQKLRCLGASGYFGTAVGREFSSAILVWRSLCCCGERMAAMERQIWRRCFPELSGNEDTRYARFRGPN